MSKVVHTNFRQYTVKFTVSIKVTIQNHPYSKMKSPWKSYILEVGKQTTVHMPVLYQLIQLLTI